MLIMLELIAQYLRDTRTLVNNRDIENKLQMWFVYNQLCIKNLIGTKLFKLNIKHQKVFGYEVYFDNFNSFFAMFTEIFIHTVYFHKLDKERPTIVDCGANIGLATIYFKLKFPNSRVICIEPDKETFKILEHNIRHNKFKDVTLVNKALSNKKGSIDFYSIMDFSGGPGNTIQKKWLSSKTIKTSVKCDKLSNIISEPIDILKIDVEGAEGRIIEDLCKTDKLREVTIINLEYHHSRENFKNNLSDILRCLDRANFEYTINPDSLICDKIYLKDYLKKKAYVLIINAIKS